MPITEYDNENQGATTPDRALRDAINVLIGSINGLRDDLCDLVAEIRDGRYPLQDEEPEQELELESGGRARLLDEHVLFYLPGDDEEFLVRRADIQRIARLL